MPARSPQNDWNRCLAIVALVCFVAQQILMPMHCVLHEHTVGDHGLQKSGLENCPTHSLQASQHMAHTGHAHPHQAADLGPNPTDAQDAEHEPHPVEDHLSQAVEKLVVGKSSQPLGSMPPLLWTLPEEHAPLVGLACATLQGQAPPPPRHGLPSRGPPELI